MQTWYWIATLGYCLAMVLIGVWIRRRIPLTQDHQANFEFWMAKRRLPGWRLAISLTAGWLMLGWVGFGMSQIYMYGLTGLWILPIPWLILCFIIILMVPFVRRVAALSLPQAIEKRFGRSARYLLAVLSFAVFLAWTQAELFMGGTLVAPFLGIPTWACMTVIVAPIVIYVFLGGFRANVATDVAQFLLMAPFMIILAVAAIWLAGQASGGNIVQAVAQSAPPLAGAGKATSFLVLGGLFPVILLVGYLPGWLIEQDLVLRLQAARSTHEARKASIWGLALIGLFVIVLPSIVALCSLVVFPPVGGASNPAIGPSGYNICSAFIEKLPPWLSVFMVMGILACQMSTVDTFANVSALAAIYDVIEPALLARSISPQGRLSVARWGSIVVLLLSLLCGIISQSLQIFREVI